MKKALTSGQTSDHVGYDAVMDDDLPQPEVLLADKGYDSNAIRDDIGACGRDCGHSCAQEPQNPYPAKRDNQ